MLTLFANAQLAAYREDRGAECAERLGLGAVTSCALLVVLLGFVFSGKACVFGTVGLSFPTAPFVHTRLVRTVECLSELARDRAGI